MSVLVTSEKAAEYKWFADQCLRSGSYGTKAIIVDGLTIICKFSPDRAILHILDGAIGFLTHPRNGAPKGFNFPGTDAAMTPTYGNAHLGLGYTKDVDDGIGEIPYPLVDDNDQIDTDNKTTVFAKEDGAWTVEKETEYNYGNVDWKGPVESDPADRLVLSYRGNPSRYWPVDQFVNIPGLSAVDHSVDGLLNSYQYMTVFSDKVYQGGKVLETMPYLYHPLNTDMDGWTANHQNAQVLGAAINSDGVLVCVVKTCYNSYPDVKAVGELRSTWQTWKNGVVYSEWLGDEDGARRQADELNLTIMEVADPGRGYFFEVIKNVAGDIAGGWKRLLRVATDSNMPNCNFFFSEDGTKACSVMLGQLHLIEIAGDTATYNVESLGGFEQTIRTVSSTTSESNHGTPGTGGIFAGIFRTDVAVGDWIDMSDTTSTYTGAKSGTVTTAADYKGNELVKMDLNLTGNEHHFEHGMRGFKWGETGLPTPSNGGVESDDASRTPGIRISVDPFDPATGVFTGVLCVATGGVCQPTNFTVTGITAVAQEDNPGCFTVDCHRYTGNITVTVGVTDAVTGRTATASKTYTGVSTAGTWVEDTSFVDMGYACIPSWAGYANVIIGDVQYAGCFARFYNPNCYLPDNCPGPDPILAAVNALVGYDVHCDGYDCLFWYGIYTKYNWECTGL